MTEGNIVKEYIDRVKENIYRLLPYCLINVDWDADRRYSFKVLLEILYKGEKYNIRYTVADIIGDKDINNVDISYIENIANQDATNIVSDVRKQLGSEDIL